MNVGVAHGECPCCLDFKKCYTLAGDECIFACSKRTTLADQGKARLLTHWEEVDYGVQCTSLQKFFINSPTIPKSFYMKYDPNSLHPKHSFCPECANAPNATAGVRIWKVLKLNKNFYSYSNFCKEGVVRKPHCFCDNVKLRGIYTGGSIAGSSYAAPKCRFL